MGRCLITLPHLLSLGRKISMYIERYAVPVTTYGAAETVKEKIKAAEGIKSIIIGVRNADVNKYATTIMLIADCGSGLFDTTKLTMERSPRELEVLSIFDVIKSVNALNKTKFITSHIPDTSSMSAIDAMSRLNTYEVKNVLPDWTRFAAMYNDKKIDFGKEYYYSKRWEELSGI